MRNNNKKILSIVTYRPVSFRALYEFVDLYQDGEPWGTGLCNRKFYSKTQAVSSTVSYTFASSKNVFLYGRGGSTNLRLVDFI